MPKSNLMLGLLSKYSYLPIESPAPEESKVSFLITIERVGEGGSEIESLLLTIIPPIPPDAAIGLPPCIARDCRTLFVGVFTEGDKVIVEGLVMSCGL